MGGVNTALREDHRKNHRNCHRNKAKRFGQNFGEDKRTNAKRLYYYP